MAKLSISTGHTIQISIVYRTIKTIVNLHSNNRKFNNFASTFHLHSNMIHVRDTFTPNIHTQPTLCLPHLLNHNQCRSNYPPILYEIFCIYWVYQPNFIIFLRDIPRTYVIYTCARAVCSTFLLYYIVLKLILCDIPRHFTLNQESTRTVTA